MNKAEAKRLVLRRLSTFLRHDDTLAYPPGLSDEDADRVEAATEELADEFERRGRGAAPIRESDDE